MILVKRQEESDALKRLGVRVQILERLSSLAFVNNQAITNNQSKALNIGGDENGAATSQPQLSLLDDSEAVMNKDFKPDQLLKASSNIIFFNNL